MFTQSEFRVTNVLYAYVTEILYFYSYVKKKTFFETSRPDRLVFHNGSLGKLCFQSSSNRIRLQEELPNDGKSILNKRNLFYFVDFII